MTPGLLPWGVAALALCAVTGFILGAWIWYERGWNRGADEAEKEMRADARWKGLPDTPARPAPPAETPRTEPGRHRHPAGPRHAELPAAGYLPAPDGAWVGVMTLPAPVQAPPWDTPPEPEPQTEVLEPTAVLPRPDPLTDSAFTRRMALDMDAWIAEHISATDATLKAITGGAR
jgi:hypothetical protein